MRRPQFSKIVEDLDCNPLKWTPMLDSISRQHSSITIKNINNVFKIYMSIKNPTQVNLTLSSIQKIILFFKVEKCRETIFKDLENKKVEKLQKELEKLNKQ